MSVTKPIVLNETFEQKMDMIGVLLANIADNGGSLVVDSPKTLQRIVRLGLAGKVLHPSDQIIIERETAMSINSSNGDLTVSVDAQTFLAKVGEAHTGVYEFVFDGLVWKLHDAEVELLQYGITCTGTPVANDEIAVHETAARLVFDVLGIDQDTPSDPNLTHTLALQMHDCMINLQFDAPEAMMVFPEGLAAGTYNITLYKGMYNESTGSDGTYQFTTAQDIPAGGFLRHTTMGQYSGNGYTKSIVTGGKFNTYKADFTALESNLACTEGSGGTSLGTISARDVTNFVAGAVAVTDMNPTERQCYGRNYWKESAARQMLNSDKAAGSVWSAQHKFDFPPSWVSTQEGFLRGLDPELVSVIGRVRKRTGLNLVERAALNANYEDTDEFVWLPSYSEVYFGKNTYGSQVDEGGPYKFYSDYSDLNAAGTGADTNRIKLLSGAARYWWLRSPSPSGANFVCYVLPTGAHNYGGASDSYGLAPAFCIV